MNDNFKYLNIYGKEMPNDWMENPVEFSPSYEAINHALKCLGSNKRIFWSCEDKIKEIISREDEAYREIKKLK